MPNAPARPNTETDQPLDLAQYYHMAMRHKWLILVCVLGLIALGLLHNARSVPVYKATATIIIDREMPKVPISQEGYYLYESYMSEVYTFNTHFKLITSREVLRDVIQKLNLDRQESRKEKEQMPGVFSPVMQYLDQVTGNIRLLLGAAEKPEPSEKPTAPAEPEDRADVLAGSLAAMIKIERVEETRLLNIHVTNPDPALARDVANTLAQAYIDFNIRNRLKSAQNTMSWLTEQLYEMRKNLEEAEGQFFAYKQEAKVVSVQDSQRMIAEKIASFNESYLKARNRRLEVEGKLEQLERLGRSEGRMPLVRSLVDNSLIHSLYGQLLEAEMELSRLSKVYKSKHPKIVQANAGIADIRAKLDQEISKEVGNLKAERSVLLAREGVLQKTVADLEKEALETNRKGLQSTIFERNVETNQKLYDTILARLKETDLSGNIDVSNIRIAERALLPRAALGENKKRNLLVAGLLGLMIGVGLALLLEYLDRSLHTEEDVERHLGLAVLSVIPVGEQARAGAYGSGGPERPKKKRRPGGRPMPDNGQSEAAAA